MGASVGIVKRSQCESVGIAKRSHQCESVGIAKRSQFQSGLLSGHQQYSWRESRSEANGFLIPKPITWGISGRTSCPGHVRSCRVEYLAGPRAQGVLDPAKRQRAAAPRCWILPDGKGQKKRPDRKKSKKSTAFPTVGRVDGLRAPILATRISPRAESAPLARWRGGSREHGDRMWFSGGLLW